MNQLHVLHLEDRDEDAFLIQRAIKDSRIDATFTLVKSREAFLEALNRGGFDIILADSSLPGIDSVEALTLARARYPEVSILSVSGAVTEDRAKAVLAAGASNYFLKDDLTHLAAAIRAEQEKIEAQRKTRAMLLLLKAVQELSLARDLGSIMTITRRAARELTGADGASFVLRDGDKCYYADEDAIAPLWKGQRFPLANCVSGWVMDHRQPAVIPDIYADPRVPVEAYRPTFVKSMAMVPIRTESPIGAIGNYWAHMRAPTPEEVELLEALANTTAVAMENVQIHHELEKRVKDRTADLEAANKELETFSYAVSHDLKSPLRTILGYSDIILKEGADKLGDTEKRHLQVIHSSGKRMAGLIEDMLRLAKYSRAPLTRGEVDLSRIVRDIVARLTATSPDRAVSTDIADGLVVEGDAGLLTAALENLLSNAWKYSAKNPETRIEFGAAAQSNGTHAYYIRDNGVGFDMGNAGNLFQPFYRLHSEDEFSGTGVGLATVQRIIQRHGGRIWAEAEVGKGATFYFTLGFK
jgi:signal transduction histidine kinase/CheY-like chemotaxis protein